MMPLRRSRSITASAFHSSEASGQGPHVAGTGIQFHPLGEERPRFCEHFKATPPSIHTHMHVHTCTHSNACTHAHMCTHSHTYMHVHTHAQMHTLTHMRTHMNTLFELSFAFIAVSLPVQYLISDLTYA